MKIFQPLLLAGGLLCLSVPSFAHWQTTYIANGSDVYGPNSQNGTQIWNNANNTELNGGDFDHYPYEVEFGNDEYVHSSGNVKFIWQWVPDNNQQTPPEYLHLKVFSSVDVKAENVNDVAGQATNGLGDPMVNGVSKGTHLVTLPVGATGQAVYEVDGIIGNLGITVANPEQFDGVVSQTHINTSSVEDPRSVTLTRNVGQDEFGLDLEHTVYEGGNAVTYGDSLYSWSKVEPNGDVLPARNFQNVQALYNGNTWTPDDQIPGVQWNWVPDGGFQTLFATTPQDSTSYSKYSSKWLMKDGVAVETLPILGVGESSWGAQIDQPQEFTLKYFARDVDGARSQATYKLTLHDPVDNVTHFVSGVDVTSGFVDVEGHPAVVDYANSLANPTINGTVDHSSGWSINGTIEHIELFAKPLGLDVGYSSSTDYGTEKSITLDKTAQPVSPGMERQVLITYKYNRHHSFFDKWNANGKVRRMAYGPGSTTRNVEVQHEGFKDEYVTSSLSFGPEYNPDLVGHAPTPTTPSTLPPPVSTFRS